jgi:hypothetical protein
MKAKLGLRPAPTARVQRQTASSSVTRKPPAQAEPTLRVIDGGLDGGMLLRLQAAVGNQAVGELIARPRLTIQAQAVACPPPPAPAPPMSPHDDPRFVAVKDRIEGESAKQKKHPPAKAKAAEAESAAKGPTNEVASKAAANQVEDMGKQKPKGFDKAGFIAAVHAAIEKKSPKTMKQVDDFTDSGKASELKGEVVGKVSAGKEAAAKDIKGATQAPPSKAGIVPKPVKPMAPETAGAPPQDVRAANAMPPPKAEEEVSLAHTPCETDNQMAEANVTEEQIANSNEPQFHEALDAKKEADEHAATAPQQFRDEEQKQLGEAKGAAGAAGAAGLSQMHHSRSSALGHVGTHKDAAKAKNEAERAKVAAELESIYNATKKDVDDILGGLDGKVGTVFDQGEKSAREAFENDYKTKKDKYFHDRYRGLRGKGRWLRDKFKGAPPEVNAFIDQAKQLYVTKMERVISDVANIVEAELNRATARIAEGRKQITDYVNKQPKELKKVAQEAATEISSKFDALDQAVEDKASDVVDDLADKYSSAMKEVDERVDAMREENKGLIDKAKDKIKGVIEAIGKVKDMLSQMAAKAAAVIGDIIAHPIRFLENLIGALKQGFSQFVDNIGKHLAEGLMGWLLGELGAAGITLPESFDLKGILHFVAQILGLTWENIRARASAMLGPEVVGMIEQGVGLFQKIAHIFTTLREQGLAGLWDMISDKIGDLKAQVMDQIQDFVITKVITAGVKWILGLLNPVGAFIKACLAIYDIVMFFISHGSEIAALVNTILDNLAAIVAGNIGAAANLVESVMAKAIPMIIGFLASLLGVGGIGEKIKSVINAVRKPINKAVDWVLKKVVKPVARLAARAVGFVKGKVKAAGSWIKKKGQAGVDYLKKKSSAVVSGLKSKFAGKPISQPGDFDSETVKANALRDAAAEVNGLQQIEDVHAALDRVRERYRPMGLKSLTLEPSEDLETVELSASASKPEERRIPFSTVFADMGKSQLRRLRLIFENKARQLSKKAPRNYVVAAITVDGKLVGSHEYNEPATGEDDPGRHAEKVVVDSYWDEALDLVREKVAKSRNEAAYGQEVHRPKLVFAISASPCHQYCAPLLTRKIIQVRSDPVIGPHADFILAPRTPYEGRMDPQKKTVITDLTAMVVLQSGAEGEIRRLQIGWDLMQLATKPEAEASWERHLAQLAHKIWEKAKKAGAR